MIKLNKAWIPNSLTMGNLLFGFLSVINASKGEFVLAGFCILFAALLDGFDGQVARMLNVSSPMGAELDSLADCVAFGIAPGYLAYSAYLSGIAITITDVKELPLGMFIAAIFPMCAAYRLARFNVSHDTKSFSGLPSPIAGIIMALVPLAFRGEMSALIHEHVVVFSIIFIITALLMVSTFRFSKPQAWVLKKLHGIKLVLLLLLILLVGIFLRKWLLYIFIGLILLYIVSGIYNAIIQFIQDRKY